MTVGDLLHTLTYQPKWLHIVGDISPRFLSVRAHGDYRDMLSEKLLNAKVNSIDNIRKPWPWSQMADLEITVEL